jgi:hypothetical protein
MNVAQQILVFALSFIFVFSSNAAINLVSNGLPRCSIVLSRGKISDADAFAAIELATYIEKVSGARVEIGFAAKSGLYPIYIEGRFSPNLPRPAAAKFAQVKNDGYLIYVSREATYIASREQVGVIYGVYEILKRAAGVRWFYPGDDGEFVPRKSDIALEEVLFVDNPVMLRRSFNHVCANVGTTEAANLWGLRNKMSVKGRFGGLRHGGGHVFSTLLPDTYFHEHPEYYGLYKGKRRPQCGNPEKITASGTGGQANQPCTSNPETVRIMKENLVRMIASRAITSFCILNNDSTAWCECENCRKLDPPGERENGLVSTRFWTLANALIDEGSKVFPDLQFVCSAYQTFQTPPTGIKPHPRALVDYCVHHRCYTHSVGDLSCPVNARTRGIIEAWRKAGMRVMTYEYSNMLPRFEVRYLPLEKVVADDLRYYASQNGAGYCDEVPPKDAVFGKVWNKREIVESWRCNFLTHYIQAYFMWAPQSDFETVLDDIGSRFYGKAWPAVREYRRLLREYYGSVDAHFMYGTANAALGMALFDETRQVRLEKLLSEAEGLVQNDSLTLERVRKEREYFELTFVHSARQYRAMQAAKCVARKISGPLMIDADANKAVWRQAQPVTDFVQFLGGGKLAKHQTVVRAAYDDNNLYLLVEGLDSEVGRLIAESKKRDDPVWKDNNFEFFFAPPVFGARYVHFVINHKGAIYDTMSRSPVDRDLDFNLKVETAVKVLDDRWVAELSVPFSELGGVAPKPGEAWPVNVGRGRNAASSADNATSSWSHEGRLHGSEGFRRILFLN